MRREWLLASASVLILLVLLEGAARLYYLVRGVVPPAPDQSLRNEWAWAAAHLLEGRAVASGGSDYDAQLGWRPNESLDAWVRRKGWGLADGDLTVPRHPRIEFVGDSFTYGLYVSDDESFAVRLGADHLTDHEIVNFGMNGFGADQMLLLYETIGRWYRPNIVVMGFYVGGFDRARLRFTYYAKPWFDIDEPGALHLHDQPVIAPQVLYGEYASGARRIAPWPTSYVWNTVAASVQRIESARRIESRNDARWRLMTALLARFADDVRADGAMPVLLIIPSRLEDYAGSIDEDVGRLAREDACRLGILPVPLAEAFYAAVARDAGTKLFRERSKGGHFTPSGHALAAAELAKALSAPSPCADRAVATSGG